MQKVVVMLAVCWLAFLRPGAGAQPGVDNAVQVRDSGSITGTVQCDAGSPAVRALVYILGESFMAKTDAGGDFTLHYVPVGTYHLVIEVAGAASAPLSVQVTKKTMTDLGVILVDCTPACTQEVCDGLDNNCNGVVDEGGVCDTGVCGNSAAEGGEACDGPDLRGQSCTSFSRFTGGTLACSPFCQFDFSACTGCIPTTEVCDGLDNNCNGVVDEGFNLSNDPFNCGGCGNVCPDIQPGIKVCMASSCRVN